MSDFQKILQSFEVKDSLNPKIWDNYKKPTDAKLKPKVLKALSRIAEEFVDYLGDDIFIEDVVLMGSLSNFNWSSYSDFDLHVLIDFSQFDKQSELYKELFNLKKKLFNDNHDIKIFGYDVELYAQDVDEPYTAAGVYSIMNNEWVSIPKKITPKIDKDVLKTKIKTWVEKIETAIENAKSTEDTKYLKTIKDKLKDYRKCGLEKGGELSYENLVFKFLRRSGHIEKLFNTQNKVFDKELSIENNKIE